MSRSDGPGPELTRRLGYLLKHAQLGMAELTAKALAPHGIDGRELAVLMVIVSGQPPSQQEAARRLGIDRTTMVALLDTLEHKGFLARRAHETDRRRNVVELTNAGKHTLRVATRASVEAERRFLAPLDPKAAEQLRDALHTVVTRPDDA